MEDFERDAERITREGHAKKTLNDYIDNYGPSKIEVVPRQPKKVAKKPTNNTAKFLISGAILIATIAGAVIINSNNSATKQEDFNELMYSQYTNSIKEAESQGANVSITPEGYQRYVQALHDEYEAYLANSNRHTVDNPDEKGEVTFEQYVKYHDDLNEQLNSYAQQVVDDYINPTTGRGR